MTISVQTMRFWKAINKELLRKRMYFSLYNHLNVESSTADFNWSNFLEMELMFMFGNEYLCVWSLHMVDFNQFHF